MPLSFDEVKTYADQIKSAYGERDTTFEAMEDIFLMENPELPNMDWIEETIDSTGRDKLLGAVRLLTAADPVWSVPRDKNSDDIDQKLAGDLEKAASKMWTAAGRIKKTPVHYSSVLAGLLYGQADISVTKTEDLLAAAKSPAQKKRMEKVAARTPLMFEALNPKTCYPVFDGYGLAAHYSAREMLVVDVRNRWGDDVLADKNATDVVDYHEFWDLEKHVVWVDGEQDPLLDVEHDLTVIPVASARMEGSDLFEDDYKWQPFLFTMYKAGSYKRMSLLKTIMFTNLSTIGTTPQFIHGYTDENRDIQTDFTFPGGKIKKPVGDTFDQLKLTAITSDMQIMYDMLQNQIETATIYSQTLGEPLGANAPYSMVAMLSQAGRLPLVPYQRMLSNLITDAMMIGIEMLRATGGKIKAGGANDSVELDLKEVPEDIELTAFLDISMPQDKAQNSKIAIELNKSGMVSLERAREEYLGIGQSDDEQEQIWTEQMSDAQMQMQIETQIAQAQAQAQQQMMQGQPGMMPQGAQMPPEMMGGMPPQSGQIPPEILGQQAAQPGLPMTEPLPPGGQPNPEDMGLPPDMGGM